MARARRGRWGTSFLLCAGLYLAYSANLREIGAGDTIPATLQPVAILRGDGLALNRFAAMWPQGLPWYVVDKHGQIISRYPLATGVFAVPFTAPQMLWRDLMHPGWDQGPLLFNTLVMGKTSASLIAALTGVAIFQLIRALGLERVALLTAAIAALGSTLFAVAGQALWQHGPAALSLTLALILLLPRRPGRARLFLAGLAVGTLMCVRPPDLTLAAPIAVWVVWRHRRDALWFLPAPLLLGATMVAINYRYFGSAGGGYTEMTPLILPQHGVEGYWSRDVIGGFLGTLFSPSHGLFVFSPWMALALVCLPATAGRIRQWPILCVALWALLPFFALLSTFSTWWGGWAFGPRYSTDVVPIFAVLLGFALDWSRLHLRPMQFALVATGVFAIAVEVIGVFCFPSSWNSTPTNVNIAHERLWDWRDSELTRCLRDGPHRGGW